MSHAHRRSSRLSGVPLKKKKRKKPAAGFILRGLVELSALSSVPVVSRMGFRDLRRTLYGFQGILASIKCTTVIFISLVRRNLYYRDFIFGTCSTCSAMSYIRVAYFHASVFLVIKWRQIQLVVSPHPRSKTIQSLAKFSVRKDLTKPAFRELKLVTFVHFDF